MKMEHAMDIGKAWANCASLKNIEYAQNNRNSYKSLIWKKDNPFSMVKDACAYCMSWLFYTEFYLFASNSPALENSIWNYSSLFFFFFK